ncbi:M14 family metallopeptidase [Aequorivita sediminis]|uniref:M14 family metallopeptidase n=1 Tax=Aequorivita sediminis TaxID=3073653 RepID=UPI0028B21A26|nr:M14 family metallopeptidase [Aequorivita sp. F6058]
MKNHLLTLSVILFVYSLNLNGQTQQDQVQLITNYPNLNKTSAYNQSITFYKNLAAGDKRVHIFEMGETDSGHPLHLVIYNSDINWKTTAPTSFSKMDKNLLLINNGIHAGEPDGIDATMRLFADLSKNSIPSPSNTIVATIPIYNIGGALNRNSTSRTNQNGPEEYGFRGNARNYDLNRDFIKSDTKNAKSFAEIFHWLNPDLFIDNHVSNGADYQYTLTHLFTQHNKLGGKLGNYLETLFIPEFENSLKEKQWDITPYVNVFNSKPEIGFSQFMDSPRYSTGYSALFNTLGMMVETHMLKPYKDRVEGTYEIMKSFITVADSNADKIKTLRQNAFKKYQIGSYYPISWEIDSTKTTTLNFKGYESDFIPSTVTGQKRLKYERNRPFSKPVTYYNNFKANDSIKIPTAYIIPKGYWNVVELLKLNNITFSQIESDTIITSEVYRIAGYQTVKSPYEGHYLHYNTKVVMTTENARVSKGDVMVKTQQPGVRYIIETLEPSAQDSFFNWNFFDAILQQKEGFSPYVWEDLAEEFLNNNPDIKEKFKNKKQTQPEFAQNWYLQLDWVHKQSPYYEKSHLRYPIIRVGS